MPRREFDLRKATPKEEVSELYRLIASEPKAVLANPIWRRLQKRDLDFLAKTPPSFRLGLLRHHFRTHKKNPWKFLAHAGQEEPAWPMWKGPMWKYEEGETIEDPHGNPQGQRFPLARGWAFTFGNYPAEVNVTDFSEGPDPDESVRLDRVLHLLFTNPGADPREELSEHVAGLMPEQGHEITFAGVSLFLPDGREWPLTPLRHPEGSGGTLFELAEIADEALIAQLVRNKDGKWIRMASENEAPRPLFASAPIIDESMSSEGSLMCTWTTDYYAPLDARAEGARSWTYERHSLAVVDEMNGTGAAVLCELAWTYQTIGDLEGAIARAIAGKAAHRLFLPIYEAMLFGSSK